MLDALARQPLWRDGLNYAHGTGHGIGSHLNVHEGPFGVGGGAVAADKGLSSAAARGRYLHELHAGYYLSDEPGFYKDDFFGVRIESDLVCVPKQTTYAWGTRAWLGFEYLSPVPMSKSLTDPALLDLAEKAWLDTFHADCWRQLAPRLTPQSLLGDKHDADQATRSVFKLEETFPSSLSLSFESATRKEHIFFFF